MDDKAEFSWAVDDAPSIPAVSVPGRPEKSATPPLEVALRRSFLTHLDPRDTMMLYRVLCGAEALTGRCRSCWIDRISSDEAGKPSHIKGLDPRHRQHATEHCRLRICDGQEWELFSAVFPRDSFCLLCTAQKRVHEEPTLLLRFRGKQCEYSDILKQLTYLVYKDEKMRDYILGELGQHPLSLSAYWRFISERYRGGILGLYLILNGLFRLVL
jgi:hypothetical protein